jgi:nitrate reductase delta subunit
MSLAEGYASLGRLLDYPVAKERMLADHAAVIGVLREKGVESPLAPFAGFVESATLSKLQEDYVATFDFNPAAAPYLGHHLFGDNLQKGAYLIRLKQEFGRHGFVPAGNELPDHLPLVLGFLAYLAEHGADGARRSFISECVLPGVDRWNAKFSGRSDSPWKAVVEAIRILCAADTDARGEGKPC